MEFKDVTSALSEVARKYQVHKPSPQFEALRDYIVKLWRMVADFLRRLFHHSSGALDSRAMSGFLQFVIVMCAVTAAFLAIALLIKRLAETKSAGSKLTKGAVEVTVPLDAAGWKRKADQLARKEDYRGACRAAYLSLLQNLDEQGIAPFAPTKTNYEYSYALSAFPQLKERFRQLADLVDTVWFGNKEAQPEDYSESCRLLTELDGSMAGAACRAAKEKAR